MYVRRLCFRRLEVERRGSVRIETLPGQQHDSGAPGVRASMASSLAAEDKALFSSTWDVQTKKAAIEGAFRRLLGVSVAACLGVGLVLLPNIQAEGLHT